MGITGSQWIDMKTIHLTPEGEATFNKIVEILGPNRPSDGKIVAKALEVYITSLEDDA